MQALPNAQNLYLMAQNKNWGDTSMGESQWIANMKQEYGNNWRRLVHNKILQASSVHSGRDVDTKPTVFVPPVPPNPIPLDEDGIPPNPTPIGGNCASTHGPRLDYVDENGNCILKTEYKDPGEQPGGGMNGIEKSFIEKYKYPLMAAGVIIVALIVMRRNRSQTIVTKK